MQMIVSMTATMGLRPMSGATGALAGLALCGMKQVPTVAESERKNALDGLSTLTV